MFHVPTVRNVFVYEQFLCNTLFKRYNISFCFKHGTWNIYFTFLFANVFSAIDVALLVLA